MIQTGVGLPCDSDPFPQREPFSPDLTAEQFRPKVTHVEGWPIMLVTDIRIDLILSILNSFRI